MNNELERILGEVADGASRQAGALSVDALRGRGARRRRTRQAGYSVVGVAAAFGLAFGAAQLLPDDGALEPAVTPTAPLPTANTSLPIGACGSVVTNMPTPDATVGLLQRPARVVAAQDEPLDLTISLSNYDSETQDWGAGESAVLLVVRDGVVVGWSWRADAALPTVGVDEIREISGFGPAVVCEQGALVPSGSADGLEPVPTGEYRTFAVLSTVNDDPAVRLTIFPGDEGELTILEAGTDSGPRLSDYVIEDVDLPACGESIVGYEFPAGTLLGTGDTLVVGADSDTTTLEVEAGWRNTVAEGAQTYANDLAGVVARDGIVVTYVRAAATGGGFPLELGENAPFPVSWTWLECEGENEETILPAGEYELLAMRLMIVEDPTGPTRSVYVGYEPVTFSIGESEDDSETSAPFVTLPVCGEHIADFTFPDGVVQNPDTLIAARAVHTDADGTTYLDGYGDQLDIVVTYGGAPGDHQSVTVIEGGAVVARDGVVVAVMALDQYRNIWIGPNSTGAAFSLDETSDWVDCASGEHTQVPKGEYELLGWHQLGWQTGERATLIETHALGPVPFTAYDFEDPDNPGHSGS